MTILSQVETVKKNAARRVKEASVTQSKQLRERMEEVRKDKRKTAKEIEEDQHKILDEEEKKLEALYSQKAFADRGVEKVFVAYTPVGRGDSTSPLSVKKRGALIAQRAKLMRKHMERSVVSEAYETTFESRMADYQKETDDAKRLTMFESMVKESSAAGRKASSGQGKREDEKRFAYHQGVEVDKLHEHYKEKYGQLFEIAYKKLVANPQSITPIERKKKIMQAKDEAKIRQHQAFMKDATYKEAYLSSSRPTEAGAKKVARKAMAKKKLEEERAKNPEYTAMFNALRDNTKAKRKTTKNATRKAQKHADRMENNPDYKAAFEAAIGKNPGVIPTSKQLRGARRAARHKARLANKTNRDEQAEAKYGDTYQRALDAYGDKYTESTSKARKHAQARAKAMSREKDHVDTMGRANADAGDLAYQTAYRDAIQSGEKPTQAQKLATKRREEARKKELASKMREEQVREKEEHLPGLQEQMGFYAGKYGDTDKALSHSVKAAKKIRDRKDAEDLSEMEIYTHPQFQDAYMEEYQKTQNNEKATKHAVKVVTALIRQEQKARKKERTALGDTQGLELDDVRRFATWRDSVMVNAVTHVKELDGKDPEEPSGILARIRKATLAKKGDKVDKPKAKKKDDKEKYGLEDMTGSMVDAGFAGYGMHSGGKDAAEQLKNGFEEVAEEGASQSKISQLFDKYSFIFAPLTKGAMLAKEIISYIKDKRQGADTTQAKQDLFFRVMEFVPAASTTVTGVGKLIAEETFKKYAPIVSGIETLISSGVDMLINIVKVSHAIKGAKVLKAQREESKNAVMTRENRPALIQVKGTFRRATKTKVSAPGVRNMIQSDEAETDPTKKRASGQIEDLKRWQRDKEYQRLFKKVIRDRGLDLAQNMVGVVQGLSSFVPKYGVFSSAIIGALNSFGTVVRIGVKEAKQMARERAAKHPTRRGAGLFNLERTKEGKHKDRSMYAEMIYGELMALPLPPDYETVDKTQRKGWLDKTLAEYKRMEVYTAMAMDLRQLLSASSKEDILSAIVSSMAASSH